LFTYRTSFVFEIRVVCLGTFTEEGVFWWTGVPAMFTQDQVLALRLRCNDAHDQ